MDFRPVVETLGRRFFVFAFAHSKLAAARAAIRIESRRKAFLPWEKAFEYAMTEEIKQAFEHLTGVGVPAPSQLRLRKTQPEAFRLADDGRTPNHPHWPLLIYRQVMSLEDGFDPAAQFEVLFDFNRWRDNWRDSMYKFNHFHTQTHEVLGLARGRLLALFGGAQGKEIELTAGDVVVIPAGVGHKCLNASRGLTIVGAYPPDGEYNEPRPGEIAHDKALDQIRQVPRPVTDPVYGAGGPLFAAWTI